MNSLMLAQCKCVQCYVSAINETITTVINLIMCSAMLSLLLALCVVTVAALVQWSMKDIADLESLGEHDRLQIFDLSDLARARMLLGKYPAISAHAEETIANMSDEDKITFRIKDLTKTTQIISSSLTSCADCLSELKDDSEDQKLYAGQLYALVVYYGVIMAKSSVLSDTERADVNKLVIKMKQGSFDDADFTKAKILLKKLSPKTVARSEEAVRTMSDSEKAAFRNKDSKLQDILISSLKKCDACILEGFHLNDQDFQYLGRLYEMVVSFGATSSSLMLRMSPFLVMTAIVAHFVVN